MKTVIGSKGVVTSNDGTGLDIYGLDYHEAPFDHRWTDLYGEIHEGDRTAALTTEGYRDTGFSMHFFKHNQPDTIFLAFQLPHDWDPASAINPHMHFIPMASGSGEITFNYMYSWCLFNQPLNSGQSWITGSVSYNVTPAEQYTQQVIQVGLLTPPADATESAIFCIRFERAEGIDTYTAAKDHGSATANVGVLFFDLHYQKIKAGSLTQF